MIGLWGLIGTRLIQMGLMLIVRNVPFWREAFTFGKPDKVDESGLNWALNRRSFKDVFPPKLWSPLWPVCFGLSPIVGQTQSVQVGSNFSASFRWPGDLLGPVSAVMLWVLICGSNINQQDMDHRFWSMLPLTSGKPFRGYPNYFFDHHSHLSEVAVPIGTKRSQWRDFTIYQLDLLMPISYR